MTRDPRLVTCCDAVLPARFLGIILSSTAAVLATRSGLVLRGLSLTLAPDDWSSWQGFLPAQCHGDMLTGPGGTWGAPSPECALVLLRPTFG
jgi:hypothetical protein